MYVWSWPLLISAAVLSMAVVACGADTSTSALPVSPLEPTQAPIPTVSLSTQPEPSPTVQRSTSPTPGASMVQSPTPSVQRQPGTTGRAGTSGGPSGLRPSSPTGRSGFVPLDNPLFLTASEASHLGEDELVLGYESKGEARAYPIGMMRYHHIVNDSVGGTPLLVTY